MQQEVSLWCPGPSPGKGLYSEPWALFFKQLGLGRCYTFYSKGIGVQSVRRRAYVRSYALYLAGEKRREEDAAEARHRLFPASC